MGEASAGGVSGSGPRAADLNRAYYEAVTPGKDDYAERMAGPVLRRQTILRLLDREPPRSIVELGCGDGRLLRAARTRFPSARLAGIDLSQPAVRANRLRDPDIVWRAIDLDAPVDVAELGEAFDAVVAAEIIEHLDHPREFLLTARALAAPGTGRLLLSTQSGPVRETERRVGHRRHYSAAAMRELLESTGWTPVEVWNCGFPFHDLSKAVAGLAPDVTMRSFTSGRYGAWQKLVCRALGLAFRFNSPRRGAQLFAVARRGGGR